MKKDGLVAFARFSNDFKQYEELFGLDSKYRKLDVICVSEQDYENRDLIYLPRITDLRGVYLFIYDRNLDFDFIRGISVRGNYYGFRIYPRKDLLEKAMNGMSRVELSSRLLERIKNNKKPYFCRIRKKDMKKIINHGHNGKRRLDRFCKANL